MAAEASSPPRDKAADEEKIYTEIHRVAWKRRTTGLLAGITMGVGFGLLIGAAVAFLPTALAVLGVEGAAMAGTTFAWPVMAEILSSAALFAGAGGLLGLTIGADVGSSAGAVTAGLTRTDPPGRTQAAVNTPAPGVSEYVNPKVGIVCAALFGGFGALLALNPLTSMALMGVPALSCLTGTAATVASGTVMGLFGATMGLNFPLMSAQLSNFYTRLVTGKMFGGQQASDSVGAQGQKMGKAARMELAPETPQQGQGLKTSMKSLVQEVIANDQEIGAEAKPAKPVVAAMKQADAAHAQTETSPTGFSPKNIIAQRESAPRTDSMQSRHKATAPQAIIAAHESGAESAADPTLHGR